MAGGDPAPDDLSTDGNGSNTDSGGNPDSNSQQDTPVGSNFGDRKLVTLLESRDAAVIMLANDDPITGFTGAFLSLLTGNPINVDPTGGMTFVDLRSHAGS